MNSWMENIGEYVSSSLAGAGKLTAGGSGDNTAITGETITVDGAQSAVVNVGYLATLTSGATLAITVEQQDSADGSNWNTATSLLSATTVLTGDSGGSTESGITSFDINLAGEAAYFRINVTPNLSAANTDTGTVISTINIAGKGRIPM